MHIQTVFLRGMISQAINKMLKKNGYSVQLELNDLRASCSNNDRKVRVHLDIDAELDDKELLDILRRTGVI